ncbi:MAG: lysyl oxidase family protein [Thermoleophilia bacterium]
MRRGRTAVALAAAAVAAGGLAVAAVVAQTGGEVIIGVADVPGAISPDGTIRYEVPFMQPGDGDLAVSRDGARAAFTSLRDGNPEIYVAELASGTLTRVTTSDVVEDRRPAWSYDGTLLAWDMGAPGARRIVVAPPEAGATPVPLTPEGAEDMEPDWSPDAGSIAFTSDRSGTRRLWSVSPFGGDPVQIPAPAGTVRSPAWAPSGAMLAVAVARPGRSVIWRITPATGRALRVSRADGVASAPEWSPDGRSLVFAFTRGLDRSLRIVPASGGRERLVPGTVGYADPDWSTAAGLLTQSPELLPDLDQRAPADIAVILLDGAWRLGFASATENLGDGPLWLRGTRERRGELRADQVIALRDGGTRVVRRVGRMRYEYHSPHFHWHFQPFVRYELRAATDHRLVVRDRKSGFCLIDRWSRALTKVPGVKPPRFTGNCGERNRNVRRIEEGTSRGYSDVYPAFYHGQDIDLTGVPDGRYVLVHRVNPERRIRELQYGNDAASALLSLRRPDGPGTRPVVRVLRVCEHTEFCQAQTPAG